MAFARCRLRTKYNSSIELNDLSSREIQFDYENKFLCYRDINDNLCKFYSLNDDETSTINNWSISKIIDYIDSTSLHISINMISNNVINIYNSPGEIVEDLTSGDIYRAGDSAFGGWSNNKIYEYDTTWIDLTPSLIPGMTCYVNYTRKSYLYDEDGWEEIGFNDSLYNFVNPIFLSSGSITPTEVSGCSLPDASSNDCWYSEFEDGEYGYWFIPIPSNCSDFTNLNLFFSTENVLGTYTWYLDWVVCTDGGTLPENNSYIGTLISSEIDSTSHSVLYLLDFTNCEEILNNNQNNYLGLKLSLSCPGGGKAKLYYVKGEFSNEV